MRKRQASIADFIIDSRIGALDRTLGFLFGAARGVLLVVVAMLFFNWLVTENQPSWISQAKSKPMIDSLGAKLISLLPEDPESTILKRLKPGSAPAPEGSPDANAPEPKEDIPPEGATNQ